MSDVPAIAPPASSDADQRAARMSLKLTREVTCIRSLAWRCDLPPALPWERLTTELGASGLTSIPAVKGLARFATSGGDEIAIVASSGRVQIRVHYTVPEQERRFAAERLFQLLVYALRRL